MLTPLAARGSIRGPLAMSAGGALPWWNPDGLTPAAVCGAWQAKGAASLAASYLNLATLGHANIDPAIVGGVAPGWDPVNGWIFPGGVNTTRLLAGYTFLNNDWSAIAQVDVTGVGGGIAGRLFSSNDDSAFIIPNNGAINVGYSNGGAIGIAPALLGVGNLAIAHSAAYRNGINDGIIPLGALGVGNLVIGNRTDAARCLQGSIQAFAIYSVTLTAAQVLARYNAMALL